LVLLRGTLRRDSSIVTLMMVANVYLAPGLDGHSLVSLLSTSLIKTTIYQVLDVNGDILLVKSHLSFTTNDFMVRNSRVVYAPRLDIKVDVPKAKVTYNPDTNDSTFVVSYPYDKTEAVVFGIGPGRFQGRVAQVEDIRPKLNQYEVVLTGDWTETDIALGYNYLMEVKLPTIYMTKEDGDKVKSDTRMYLTIHRLKFQFADVGLFETEVQKQGKDTYKDMWEMSPGDHYLANTHEVLPTVFHTVPIYEKNIYNSVTLSSRHPTPASLLSLEWEGMISPKSYKSV